MRPGDVYRVNCKEGLHHLVWEIVDNSIDEALAGFASHIQVFIEPDNSITVVDDGRGIPVDIQKKQVDLPFGNCLYYSSCWRKVWRWRIQKVSGGLHELAGSSVVNALSNSIGCSCPQNGKIHYQEYRRGHVVPTLR